MKRLWKNKYYLLIFGIMFLLVLSSCAKKKETVSLTIWGPAASSELLRQMADTFTEKYAEEADIVITIGVEEENTFKDTALSNPEAVADVFIFPNDQIHDLVMNNILLPVQTNTEEIIAENGGELAASVLSATYDNQLYAYPMTASNGYFMYYDSSYFTEEDVESLDRMLGVAAAAGKKVSMEWSSGWYLYSFFAGAGFSLNMEEDGRNTCNFNGKVGGIKGCDVLQSMLDISASPGFMNADSDKFAEGIEDGSVIAGVNGTWNAKRVEEALGDNYAACKLPTFTLNGEQVQMRSFAGYKLVGVSANSTNTEWASRLAEWITSYDNQILRFEQVGEGPSNVAAGKSQQVLAAPAIRALSAQGKFANIQNVGDAYWQPMVKLGMVMASGNPDEIDLQYLLDEVVDEITEIPKEE